MISHVFWHAMNLPKNATKKQYHILLLYHVLPIVPLDAKISQYMINIHDV